ncbi:hypothetical protein ATANTOWER_007465 [Ataeniobius toweri]|uniref:Uncharacterized protein n=1 Tax=Ataeniobius toweri TaxID=208326 RepID=A0ABU7AF70_9TELE|nr:hypothetical protein [Ataeniobius toweri]
MNHHLIQHLVPDLEFFEGVEVGSPPSPDPKFSNEGVQRCSSRFIHGTPQWVPEWGEPVSRPSVKRRKSMEPMEHNSKC